VDFYEFWGLSREKSWLNFGNVSSPVLCSVMW